MSEPHPLAIWPWPLTEADGAALRGGYLALNPGFPVTPVPAVPGGPVRVVALREPPPFLCDHALIRDPANPNAVIAALAWATEVVSTDPRATLLLDQLRGIMGAEVREVAA